MKEEEEEKENPTIKHLVIAGGGTYGYQAYGFLQELRENEIYPDKFVVEAFLGTPKYISVFIHEGHSPSLRDDMISCLYVYLFSKTKQLPWDVLPRKSTENDIFPENHIQEFYNQERMDKKNQLKQKVQDTHLGKALTLMEKTGFGENPNYNQLTDLFIGLI